MRLTPEAENNAINHVRTELARELWHLISPIELNRNSKTFLSRVSLTPFILIFILFEGFSAIAHILFRALGIPLLNEVGVGNTKQFSESNSLLDFLIWLCPSALCRTVYFVRSFCVTDSLFVRRFGAVPEGFIAIFDSTTERGFSILNY